MDKGKINVLLIGKSGVGKSSLINYIFGKEVEKTHAGEPVTKKGLHPHELKINKNLDAVIYDTNGIEPGNLPEWKSMIHEELKKRNKEGISEWFHSIIFCINSNSARVEDFELDFVKQLQCTEGINILLVITHSDNKEVNKELKKRISNKLGGIKTVSVCNVQKSLIGGKKLYQFGREEVLNYIQLNFWENIVSKLFLEINEDIKKILNQWLAVVSKEAEKIIFKRLKTIDSIGKDLENMIDCYIKYIIEYVVNKINEKIEIACNYYNYLFSSMKVPVVFDSEQLLSIFSFESFKNQLFLLLKEYESSNFIYKILHRLEINNNIYDVYKEQLKRISRDIERKMYEIEKKAKDKLINLFNKKRGLYEYNKYYE